VARNAPASTARLLGNRPAGCGGSGAIAILAKQLFISTAALPIVQRVAGEDGVLAARSRSTLIWPGGRARAREAAAHRVIARQLGLLRLDDRQHDQ
jgi:hypothetical protein